MDTTINPVPGNSQPYIAPAAKAPVTSPTPAAQAVQAPAESQKTNTSSAGTYEAALRQAALSFKDVYAVSDQQFSIFKDTTGQFITRYVSLRDGKVTYVPEPVLVKPLQLAGQQLPSRLAINV